jgi:DNA processing protein
VILTDRVVDRNDRARALVGRPGVHVASGLSEVADIVGQLMAERADVNAELHRLDG